MRRWFWINFILIFLLGMLEGCGQGREKYVGTWIAQVNVTAFGPPTYQRGTLEIRRDGTWEINLPPSPAAVSFFLGRRGNKWEVKKKEILLYYGYFMKIPQAYGLLIDNNKLIHRDSGTIFTKQG
jgi:hypothetical protein